MASQHAATMPTTPIPVHPSYKKSTSTSSSECAIPLLPSYTQLRSKTPTLSAPSSPRSTSSSATPREHRAHARSLPSPSPGPGPASSAEAVRPNGPSRPSARTSRDNDRALPRDCSRVPPPRSHIAKPKSTESSRRECTSRKRSPRKERKDGSPKQSSNPASDSKRDQVPAKSPTRGQRSAKSPAKTPRSRKAKPSSVAKPAPGGGADSSSRWPHLWRWAFLVFDGAKFDVKYWFREQDLEGEGEPDWTYEEPTGDVDPEETPDAEVEVLRKDAQRRRRRRVSRRDPTKPESPSPAPTRSKASILIELDSDSDSDSDHARSRPRAGKSPAPAKTSSAQKSPSKGRKRRRGETSGESQSSTSSRTESSKKPRRVSALSPPSDEADRDGKPPAATRHHPRVLIDVASSPVLSASSPSPSSKKAAKRTRAPDADGASSRSHSNGRKRAKRSRSPSAASSSASASVAQTPHVAQTSRLIFMKKQFVRPKRKADRVLDANLSRSPSPKRSRKSRKFSSERDRATSNADASSSSTTNPLDRFSDPHDPFSKSGIGHDGGARALHRQDALTPDEFKKLYPHSMRMMMKMGWDPKNPQTGKGSSSRETPRNVGGILSSKTIMARTVPRESLSELEDARRSGRVICAYDADGKRQRRTRTRSLSPGAQAEWRIQKHFCIQESPACHRCKAPLRDAPASIVSVERKSLVITGPQTLLFHRACARCSRCNGHFYSSHGPGMRDPEVMRIAREMKERHQKEAQDQGRSRARRPQWDRSRSRSAPPRDSDSPPPPRERERSLSLRRSGRTRETAELLFKDGASEFFFDAVFCKHCMRHATDTDRAVKETLDASDQDKLLMLVDFHFAFGHKLNRAMRALDDFNEKKRVNVDSRQVQADFLQVEGRRDDVTGGLLEAWETLNPAARFARDYRSFRLLFKAKLAHVVEMIVAHPNASHRPRPHLFDPKSVPNASSFARYEGPPAVSGHSASRSRSRSRSRKAAKRRSRSHSITRSRSRSPSRRNHSHISSSKSSRHHPSSHRSAQTQRRKSERNSRSPPRRSHRHRRRSASRSPPRQSPRAPVADHRDTRHGRRRSTSHERGDRHRMSSREKGHRSPPPPYASSHGHSTPASHARDESRTSRTSREETLRAYEEYMRGATLFTPPREGPPQSLKYGIRDVRISTEETPGDEKSVPGVWMRKGYAQLYVGGESRACAELLKHLLESFPAEEFMCYPKRKPRTSSRERAQKEHEEKFERDKAERRAKHQKGGTSSPKKDASSTAKGSKSKSSSKEKGRKKRRYTRGELDSNPRDFRHFVVNPPVRPIASSSSSSSSIGRKSDAGCPYLDKEALRRHDEETSSSPSKAKKRRRLGHVSPPADLQNEESHGGPRRSRRRSTGPRCGASATARNAELIDSDCDDDCVVISRPHTPAGEESEQPFLLSHAVVLRFQQGVGAQLQGKQPPRAGVSSAERSCAGPSVAVPSTQPVSSETDSVPPPRYRSRSTTRSRSPTYTRTQSSSKRDRSATRSRSPPAASSLPPATRTSSRSAKRSRSPPRSGAPPAAQQSDSDDDCVMVESPRAEPVLHPYNTPPEGGAGSRPVTPSTDQHVSASPRPCRSFRPTRRAVSVSIGALDNSASRPSATADDDCAVIDPPYAEPVLHPYNMPACDSGNQHPISSAAVEHSSTSPIGARTPSPSRRRASQRVDTASTSASYTASTDSVSSTTSGPLRDALSRGQYAVVSSSQTQPEHPYSQASLSMDDVDPPAAVVRPNVVSTSSQNTAAGISPPVPAVSSRQTRHAPVPVDPHQSTLHQSVPTNSYRPSRHNGRLPFQTARKRVEPTGSSDSSAGSPSKKRRVDTQLSDLSESDSGDALSPRPTASPAARSDTAGVTLASRFALTRTVLPPAVIEMERRRRARLRAAAGGRGPAGSFVAPIVVCDDDSPPAADADVDTDVGPAVDAGVGPAVDPESGAVANMEADEKTSGSRSGDASKEAPSASSSSGSSSSNPDTTSSASTSSSSSSSSSSADLAPRQVSTCMTYEEYWCFQHALRRVDTFKTTCERDIEVINAYKVTIEWWAWHINVDPLLGDAIMEFFGGMRRVLASFSEEEGAGSGPFAAEEVEAMQKVLSAKIALNATHLELVGGALKDAVEEFWVLIRDRRHIFKFDKSLNMQEDVGMATRLLREEIPKCVAALTQRGVYYGQLFARLFDLQTQLAALPPGTALDLPAPPSQRPVAASVTALGLSAPSSHHAGAALALPATSSSQRPGAASTSSSSSSGASATSTSSANVIRTDGAGHAAAAGDVIDLSLDDD